MYVYRWHSNICRISACRDLLSELMFVFLSRPVSDLWRLNIELEIRNPSYPNYFTSRNRHIHALTIVVWYVGRMWTVAHVHMAIFTVNWNSWICFINSLIYPSYFHDVFSYVLSHDITITNITYGVRETEISVQYKIPRARSTRSCINSLFTVHFVLN